MATSWGWSSSSRRSESRYSGIYWKTSAGSPLGSDLANISTSASLYSRLGGATAYLSSGYSASNTCIGSGCCCIWLNYSNKSSLIRSIISLRLSGFASRYALMAAPMSPLLSFEWWLDEEALEDGRSACGGSGIYRSSYSFFIYSSYLYSIAIYSDWFTICR